MTETVEIYFSDLNEKGQKKVLYAFGVDSPEELNMDIDIVPLEILEVENE